MSLALVTVLSLLVFVCHKASAGQKKNGSLITDYLRDGELERRVKFRKWYAKETSSVHMEDGERTGALLWQVTDGERFIQLIFNGDRVLQDCEYLKDRQIVSGFLEKFQYDSSLLNSTPNDITVSFTGFRNVTVEPISTADDLPSDIKEIVDYRKLRKDCKALHKGMRAIYDKMKNGTKEEKNEAEVELVSSRSRRGTFMPGSMWCGNGNRATRYAQLGSSSGADRCCRDHDHCSFVIPGHGERYNYKNSGVFTMSYCDCDERYTV